MPSMDRLRAVDRRLGLMGDRRDRVAALEARLEQLEPPSSALARVLDRTDLLD